MYFKAAYLCDIFDQDRHKSIDEARGSMVFDIKCVLDVLVECVRGWVSKEGTPQVRLDAKKWEKERKFPVFEKVGQLFLRAVRFRE